MDLRPGRELVARGGKGHEVVKRSTFVRVVPPPIELADWDAVEGKKAEANGHGEQKTLFS
jgi:DNA gyrase subunit A